MINTSITLAFMAGAAVGVGICAIYDKYYRKKEVQTITKYIYDTKAPVKSEPVVEPRNTETCSKTAIQTAYDKVIRLPSNEPSAAPADSELDLADGIRIISPNDFGFDNYYSKVTLRYYSKDGILVDEDNDEVELLEDTISAEGPDAIGHFTAGIGYFRNDNLHIDYEVIEDERSYHEIRGVEEGTFIS